MREALVASGALPSGGDTGRDEAAAAAAALQLEQSLQLALLKYSWGGAPVCAGPQLQRHLLGAAGLTAEPTPEEEVAIVGWHMRS